MIATIVIKKNNFNKNQQMIGKKNQIDPSITEHHPPENEVDFEILWRYISKIRRTSQRRCMRGELLKFEQ